MNKFLITINRKDGLTPDHLERLTHYMKGRFPAVVVTQEPCKSGMIHLHAFGESKLTRAAIRNHLARHCEKELKFILTPNLIKVQKADNGARSYVIKGVTDTKPPLACKGWRIEDLLLERQESLKKLNIADVKGKDKIVHGDEAVPLIIKFAQSSKFPITDKHSFIEIVMDMKAMGFTFYKVKMQSVYGEVMARCGNKQPGRDLLEMQLCGMS